MYHCISSWNHSSLATCNYKHPDDLPLLELRSQLKTHQIHHKTPKLLNQLRDKMVAAVCVFVRKQVLFIFYLLDLEPWDTDQGALFERDHVGGFPRIYLFS